MNKIRTKFESLQDLDTHIQLIHKRQTQELDRKISEVFIREHNQLSQLNSNRSQLEFKLVQQQLRKDNAQFAQQLSQMRDFQLQELKSYEYLRNKKKQIMK
ncbi:hypothetical protein SS50377_22394 [Spironucleus salmonicida]|uniref:Uncharacterized protein n=1 Tax=Spironucleus salmonicida TaxID=348837 RepID=V6LEI5_9EUKA|nr:hypothetical protein SS50377_22394 [Spironucleus salmonicida]|eukprot:EST42111.1 Hypothetical protein SS50377_18420 [Spironucleus salmonicida]